MRDIANTTEHRQGSDTNQGVETLGEHELDAVSGGGIAVRLRRPLTEFSKPQRRRLTRWGRRGMGRLSWRPACRRELSLGSTAGRRSREAHAALERENSNVRNQWAIP